FIGHSAGHRPSECPFRKPCGTGETSRKDFFHNPRPPFPENKQHLQGVLKSYQNFKQHRKKKQV
ncbi:MAG: hypothetical protein RI973_680, partial [Bacteroidota bacterium]